MRKLIQNEHASISPLVFFVLTIIGFGLLYTITFIWILIPEIAPLIPASDAKTFIMMCIYGMPLIVMVVGTIALIRKALRDRAYEEGYR